MGAVTPVSRERVKQVMNNLEFPDDVILLCYLYDIDFIVILISKAILISGL